MRTFFAGLRASLTRVPLVVVGLLVVASASCDGGSSSSNAPASPSAPIVATVTIATISASAETSGTNLVYHVTFTLRETGGNAGATITAVDCAFSNGSTGHADSPMQTARITAGGSLDSKTIDITDSSGRSLASSVTATVSFTDDGNHAGTVAGNASITPPTQTFTLTGVVTDGATTQPIQGAVVSIGTSASIWTDGNGNYSFTRLPGGVAVTATASATGYTASSRTVTLFADTRVDFPLAKTTPPGVVPDVEYRVSGTTTRVNHINYTDSSESTVQVGIVAPPWSYMFSGARTGQPLSVSAQNDLSVGCIKVQIFIRGVLYKESEDCSLFGTATASGSF